MAWISAAPPMPTSTPAAPPMRPMTSDSPMICRRIRPLRQPIALSVPNSRTRRVTADIVSRLARPNAAASTATASHLPRLLARLEALDSEPVTSLARSLEVVTVALGRAAEISAGDRGDVRGALGGHVDRVDLVRHPGQGLRAGQRDVDVRGAGVLRSVTMPITVNVFPAICDRRAGLEALRRGVVGVDDGDAGRGVGGTEVAARVDLPGGERA